MSLYEFVKQNPCKFLQTQTLETRRGTLRVFYFLVFLFSLRHIDLLTGTHKQANIVSENAPSPTKKTHGFTLLEKRFLRKDLKKDTKTTNPSMQSWHFALEQGLTFRLATCVEWPPRFVSIWQDWTFHWCCSIYTRESEKLTILDIRECKTNSIFIRENIRESEKAWGSRIPGSRVREFSDVDFKSNSITVKLICFNTILQECKTPWEERFRWPQFVLEDKNIPSSNEKPPSFRLSPEVKAASVCEANAFSNSGSVDVYEVLSDPLSLDVVGVCGRCTIGPERAWVQAVCRKSNRGEQVQNRNSVLSSFRYQSRCVCVFQWHTQHLSLLPYPWHTTKSDLVFQHGTDVRAQVSLTEALTLFHKVQVEKWNVSCKNLDEQWQ